MTNREFLKEIERVGYEILIPEAYKEFMDNLDIITNEIFVRYLDDEE